METNINNRRDIGWNKTEKGRTGFVIGESLRDLESFFICFDLQERIDLCSKNAREMWIDKYSEYVDRFMFSKYIPFIIN